MVRGLFSKLSFAFRYFAGLVSRSAKLFQLVWEAKPNRKFYKIHRGEELTYNKTKYTMDPGI